VIYTVTFNPSLDYVVRMKHFETGAINRAEQETIYPGGKGINVALVLGNLHIPARILGFTAGFTGQEIVRLCKENGGDCDFITLDQGNSRINLKISAADETAVNGMGPDIPEAKLQLLWEKIQTLKAGDTLVLAGSIPAVLPGDMYEDIMKRLQGRQIRVVVDATGDLLRNVIAYHPFLIKPNQFELGELFSVILHTDEEIITCGKRLQSMGARNVLVSLGEAGALLIGEDGQVYRRAAPQGKMVNSVGAGDSMVAGFLAGYESSGGNLEEALKLGLCAGSATAFQEWLATEQEIRALYEAL
jgi:1-phosphofructokinase